MSQYRILLLLSLLLFHFVANALEIQQKEKIKGKIIDATTEKPISFVNVTTVKNPYIGTTSNANGKFSFTIENVNDTLIVSCLGYYTQKVYIPDFKRKGIILLKPENITIDEVIVRPNANKAHLLLKGFLRKREELNPNKVKNIRSKQYTKSTIVINNMEFNRNDGWLFKKLGKALIKKKGNKYTLPVLFSENEQIAYIDNEGKETKTLISEKRNAIKLFDNNSIKEITNDMVENTNFFNNYIPLLGKFLPSPIGSNSLFYYKMYVADSSYNDNDSLMYRINYYPKNKRDVGFRGYFWIEENSYVVNEIYAEIPKASNINYVRSLKVKNDLQQVNDSVWYHKRKETQMTFTYNTATDSLKSFTVDGRKVRYYSDVATINKNLQVAGQAKLPPKISVKVNRPEQLSKYEKTINTNIDSLKQNSLVIFADKMTNMFMNGYFEVGKLDIGPIIDAYKNNQIEGARVTLGLRTNQNVSENKSIGGYIGYGAKDKKWKYGATLLYRFKNLNYNKLTLDFWDDVMSIGYSENLLLLRENAYTKGDDNLVSSIFSVKRDKFLSRRRHFSLVFLNDFKRGVTQNIKYQYNTIWDSEFVDFGAINHFNYQQLTYGLRFSFDEKSLEEYFHRVLFGNIYPIIHAQLSAGKYSSTQNNGYYFRLHSSIKHRINIGIGNIRYLVEAGAIFNEVPYPLLEIHRGNQTLGLARYSYNMLNYMEYASDKYLNLHSSVQLDGYFFNRIPLLRRLNLRETASAKMIIGSLEPKHNSVIALPKQLSAVKNPYVEVGVGVSNIFKIGKIEYIWRLTDRDKPGIQKSGVRFRFEISF